MSKAIETLQAAQRRSDDGWPTFTFFVKVGTARSNVIAFLYTHPRQSRLSFFIPQNNFGATVKERRLQRRVKLAREFRASALGLKSTNQNRIEGHNEQSN
jgi:hypothetical protein